MQLLGALSEYPPEELKIWLKHARKAQKKGENFASMLEPLHKELLDKGFVEEGWWDQILANANNGEEG